MVITYQVHLSFLLINSTDFLKLKMREQAFQAICKLSSPTDHMTHILICLSETRSSASSEGLHQSVRLPPLFPILQEQELCDDD